jgi:hypothetical protein
MQMQVENATDPTPEQAVAPSGDESTDGPIVMVDLLKFKERAKYSDGRATTPTGEQAYARYGEPMKQLIEARGGRFIYGGRTVSLFIGHVD